MRKEEKQYNRAIDSRFQGVIRIDPKNKEWIKKNKKLFSAKTDAGFLDLIINDFKKYAESKLSKMQKANGEKTARKDNKEND